MEAISSIMQSVGFSSPMKILIQKQLVLTSWGGLLSGAYILPFIEAIYRGISRGLKFAIFASILSNLRNFHFMFSPKWYKAHFEQNFKI